VHGTQHDALGNPVVDAKKFPNMTALVEFGHRLEVKMGFYQNGCASPGRVCH
jgi:hypothetical protein